MASNVSYPSCDSDALWTFVRLGQFVENIKRLWLRAPV